MGKPKVPDLETVQNRLANTRAAARKQGWQAEPPAGEPALPGTATSEPALQATTAGEPALPATAAGEPAPDTTPSIGGHSEETLFAAATPEAIQGGAALLSAMFTERQGQRARMGPQPRPLCALPLPQLAALSREERDGAFVLRVVRAAGNTVTLVDRMGGDHRGLVSVAKTLAVHGQGFLVVKVRGAGLVLGCKQELPAAARGTASMLPVNCCQLFAAYVACDCVPPSSVPALPCVLQDGGPSASTVAAIQVMLDGLNVSG